MQSKHVRLIVVATTLGLAATAKAGFNNGGFEDNNFGGWTVEHGRNGGSNNFVPTAGTPDVLIVGPGYNDPYSPYDTPFNGTYMARLNDFQNGNEAVRISQTGVMAAGETQIFINWAAVMEDPGHATGQDPFFDITVKVNGVIPVGGQESHSAGAGVGWTAGGSGPNGSTIYYKAGQFNLTGLNTGDQVEVILTILDCSLSGHAGWAYLDGIGTQAPPPPPGVNAPDSGVTIAMLASALLGLAAFRRRFL